MNWLPLGDMVIWGDVQAEDRRDLVGKYNATKVVISPGYFAAMGIPVVRGRSFTDRDTGASQPVLIVSESVARRLWPDGDAIGKRMALKDRPQPSDWLTVVGVVGDVRQGGLRSPPAHAVYQPYPAGQEPVLPRVHDLRRAHGRRPGAGGADDARRAQPAGSRSRAAVDGRDGSVIDRTIAESKFQTRALVVFSIAALLLAVVGIYGVLSSAVSSAGSRSASAWLSAPTGHPWYRWCSGERSC